MGLALRPCLPTRILDRYLAIVGGRLRLVARCLDTLINADDRIVSLPIAGMLGP
jgi:hypothetical protein